MIGFVKRLWAAAPIATVVLALALLFGAFFTARTVAFWVYWHDPAHRQQAVAAWMTPGFVAHSWHVPREVVLEAIDAPPSPGHPMSLEELAAQRGVPVSTLVDEINAAIAAFNAAHRPPPPAPIGSQ